MYLLSHPTLLVNQSIPHNKPTSLSISLFALVPKDGFNLAHSSTASIASCMLPLASWTRDNVCHARPSVGWIRVDFLASFTAP
mmetsp:Transcript_28222/g.51422  ORF Transcript_28222/g.51422 Transcript_28222/m.51422 type:complete len:83 (+) Transcript_28222:205-453(+)